MRKIEIEFIGAGSATSTMNNSSAVVSVDSSLMCIDYGFTTFAAFKARYDKLPDAVYLTHLHMDHCAGLESLFFEALFKSKKLIKLYIPFHLVARLQRMFGENENILANGQVNFWDVFQLIPVSECFWFEDVKFYSYPVRHHGLNSAFCLQLKGKFFYSGDTRPIPEILNTEVMNNEIIFHDACPLGNPSHSGIDELLDCYSKNILNRMYIYHHDNDKSLALIESKGLKSIKEGDLFKLY